LGKWRSKDEGGRGDVRKGPLFPEKRQGFAAIGYHEERDIAAALFDGPLHEIDIGRIVFYQENGS